MGCFCPKNTFLPLKHYIQRIYSTSLSTTCVKIHQMTYVIFETISHFSSHNPSIFLQLKHYIFSTKVAYQSENFQTCHCSHQNSPNSSCHFWKPRVSFSSNIAALSSFMRLFCTFSSKSLYALDKRIRSKCKFSDFQLLA